LVEALAISEIQVNIKNRVFEIDAMVSPAALIDPANHLMACEFLKL
jgi:hypothetical protein